MKVRDVMTPEAKPVWITDSLAAAAKSMWENDCGVLPVIKDARKVVGMITDRDICMATAMRDRNASAISVEEALTGQLFSVTADEDIGRALELMQEHKVRRLPVLDEEGELTGILSMNDILFKAKEGSGKKAPPLTYTDVVKTYRAICERPAPLMAAAAASAE
jgi:CBS-domain-containing membrane protein